MLLGVLVVWVIALIGVKVLTDIHAQTPSASPSIGTAASFTAAPGQLQTSGGSDQTTSNSGESNSSANSAASNEKELTSLNKQVAAAINDFRKKHGLNSLDVSNELNASARQHSMEMGAKGYFAHNSADGTLWWKRIMHYYPQGNYTYWTVGENLLFSSPSISAADAMKLWIGSPEHLANLKNKNWRDLGVSAVHVTDAGGVYDGYTVTIITTDFGARHYPFCRYPT